MSLSVAVTPQNSPGRLSQPPVEICSFAKPQIWKMNSEEGVVVTHCHHNQSEPPKYGWDFHHIPFLNKQLESIRECQRQIKELLETALLSSSADEKTIKALKLALEKDTLQIHEYSSCLNDLNHVYTYFS